MIENGIIPKLDNAMKELERTRNGIQNRKTAYAFIKALLNMGGRTRSTDATIPFFAVCDKMYEIYPNSSYPSYVMKILAKHGIVFNAGSNKYKIWSLPLDSIETIRGAIERYK